MPRHGSEWAELDDLLTELETPAMRLVEGVCNLRVADFFFALAVLLSAALFLSARQPPAQASQRFAASIVGAPSPAHCRSRNQTPRAADWDMQAKGLAASTLDSLSHVYANSA